VNVAAGQDPSQRGAAPIQSRASLAMAGEPTSRTTPDQRTRPFQGNSPNVRRIGRTCHLRGSKVCAVKPSNLSSSYTDDHFCN
jgi:hypothetical protein